MGRSGETARNSCCCLCVFLILDGGATGNRRSGASDARGPSVVGIGGGEHVVFGCDMESTGEVDRGVLD
jgi:hypothetical protein